MRVKEIYEYLDSISPFSLQEEWDNSGLNIGDFNQKIEKIYISLDIDEKVINKIEDNSLIITHHPLIFKGIKRLIPNSFSSKYAIELIKKNVSLIAMHTNFDKTHLNRFFVEKVLKLKGEIENFIYYIDFETNFEIFTSYVKEKMNLEHLRVVKTKDKINRIAITTGSGMGLLEYIKADCFLTGDIKYHEAMEAKARGINLIDIEHFHSEKYFIDALSEELEFEYEKIYVSNPFDLR
jgi:dinuclear metal center YbgI/SA1388 family protein